MGKTQDAMVISHKTALWTPGLNKQEQLSQRVEILPLHNCNNLNRKSACLMANTEP